MPAERKEAAREGLVNLGREVDFARGGAVGARKRLESPWVLDDLVRLVGELGDRLEVIMIPKVEARGTSATSTACSPSSRPATA